MKKYLAISVLTALLLNIPVQNARAQDSTYSSRLSERAFFSYEFEMIDNAFLKSLIEEEFDNDEENSVEGLLTRQLKAGERLALSMNKALPYEEFSEDILLLFKTSDEQWETLTEGRESTGSYRDTPLYKEEYSDYFAKIGDFLVFSSAVETLTHAIDISAGKAATLDENEKYQSVAPSFLNGNFFSLFVDLENLIRLFQSVGVFYGSDEASAARISDVMTALYDTFGASAAKSADGYKFRIDIKGSDALPVEDGLSHNQAGQTVPHLYKKLPAANTIAYIEHFNPKAHIEFSEKVNGMLREINGPYSEFVVNDEATPTYYGMLMNVYRQFEQSAAIALQFDDRSPFPYLTIMGEVGENTDAAMKLHNDIVTSFMKNEAHAPLAYEFENGDALTKITIDLTKFEPDYSGPPFPKIVLTVGMTDDGYFIFSTYPDAEKPEVRTGILDDENFTSAYQERDAPMSLLAYFNPRMLWDYFDNYLSWGTSTEDAKFAADLDFYRSYFSTLDDVYGMRDLIVTETNTETATIIDGTVRTDEEKHQTYGEFVTLLQEKDTDSDGVSDFEELFLYKSPVTQADQDNDGLSDFEELKRARHPQRAGKLFPDVDEGQWYSEAIGHAWNRGIVRGFGDGMFKPNENVSRAAFVTMVVRALQSSDPITEYLSTCASCITYYYGENFPDVSKDDWFYKDVIRAHSLGLIVGEYDRRTSSYYFKPLEPITRAEAVAILDRASAAIREAAATSEKAEPQFYDVMANQWFFASVRNAYHAGITTGKNAHDFAPFDNLTRAEAATFIMRALRNELGYSQNTEYNERQEGWFFIRALEDVASMFTSGW